MKTYSITGKTSGYIAQRDELFAGKTEIIIASGLTLKEAQKKLLDMYCADAEFEAPNWGIAVAQAHHHSIDAHATMADGTRSYEYDSRYYSIVEEEDLVDLIDFTEEEYNKSIEGDEDATSFEEFIANVKKIQRENNGTIEDAVAIANSAFFG